MLPIPKIIWHEYTTRQPAGREKEPSEAMNDLDQVRAYVEAYEWGGPSSALLLHHLREVSRLIRPGDTVVDLACGPGPLLLELAALYPETRFIGVDLSAAMLEHLEREARRRGLSNITVRREDITRVSSLGEGVADLVISTSALHHLPDDLSLRRAFRRMASILKPDGALYVFDLGLLKSRRTMKVFAAEIARLAPPLAVRDYEYSLPAAFPLETVFTMAREALPKATRLFRTRFVDFFFFLQSPPRTRPAAPVRAYLAKVRKRLSFSMKAEHALIRIFRRREDRTAPSPSTRPGLEPVDQAPPVVS